MAGAADREVIKEFLVALGFQVSAPSFKQFFAALNTSDKMAKRTSLAVLGVAIAAEEMVRIFSKNMEKMYYAAQRNKSTVESLQALSFGAEQVGISVEEITGAIESMSKSLRTQPGSRALLDELLGKPTEQMDNVKAFYELIRKLREMPHPIGTQFAAQFGIDEKTFLMAKDHLEDFIAADARRRQMNKDAGIDAQRAAESAREYMNILRDLWERVGIVGQKIAIDLLPTFKKVAEAVRDGLAFLAKLDYSSLDSLLDTVDKQAEHWAKWGSEIKLVTDSLRAWKNAFGIESAASAAAFVMGGPNWRGGGRPEGGLFPPGTPGYNAAARVLANKPGEGPPSAELGQQLVALGMLRRIARTQKSFQGDEYDALQEAITRHENRVGQLRAQGFVPAGVNAPGALEMMRQADAGGPGITINQTNNFDVRAPDPASAASAVAKKQDGAAQDIVRNLRGAVR